jgi:hypothetical protein
LDLGTCNCVGRRPLEGLLVKVLAYLLVYDSTSLRHCAFAWAVVCWFLIRLPF